MEFAEQIQKYQSKRLIISRSKDILTQFFIDLFDDDKFEEVNF
jgi:hypothetical protein